jgi:hypothetical protein
MTDFTMAPIPDERRGQHDDSKDNSRRQQASIHVVVVDKEFNNLKQHEGHARISHEHAPDAPFFQLCRQSAHDELLRIPQFQVAMLPADVDLIRHLPARILLNCRVNSGIVLHHFHR